MLAALALLASAACNGKRRPKVLVLSTTIAIREGHEAAFRNNSRLNGLLDPLKDVVVLSNQASNLAFPPGVAPSLMHPSVLDEHDR